MNLEHQFPNDWDVTRRNFEKLMQVVPDMGGQSAGIRFGNATATWTATNFSAAVVINHGLGTTPVTVTCGSRNADLSYGCTARDATTITVTGVYITGGAITVTRTFDWLVIG